MDLVTLQDVRDAAARLRDTAWPTPLVPCDPLPGLPSWNILVKAENLQHTGSFKVRGAANALFARSEREGGARAVVTYSAGNHGAGAAYAATRLGIGVTVCMPPASVPVKVAAVRRFGGRVVLTDDLIGTTRSLAAEAGSAVLHPFDDHDVIAGQGTVGLEILDHCPNPDAVIVPVGGGGLVSGVGTVLAALSPATRIIGVEPDGAASMSHALAAGALVSLPTPARSVADGLTAPAPGEITYAHARRLVHRMVSVSEREILGAWARMIAATRLFVEPSAAVTLAALRSGELDLPDGATVVLVASGGNAAPGAPGLRE